MLKEMRANFIGVVVLIVFALIVCGLVKSAKNASAAATDNTATQECCATDDQKPHLLTGTYYAVKDNFKAKLLLNNKGPQPLEAFPTLISMNGERFTPTSVVIEARSFRMIDMSEWVTAAGSHFKEGSLQVFHVGRDLVLGAQVYLVDEEHSLSFDEKLVETNTFKSSQLEGLWSLPSQRGSVHVALSNTSDNSVTVSIAAEGNKPQRAGQLNLELSAHQTRLLDLMEDVVKQPHGAVARYGGISIHYSGAAGNLMARGFAQDEQVGYSLPVQFSDPAAAKSSELQGVGLRLGSAGNELLTPLVVLKNIGSESTVVTGRLPYTRDDGTMGAVSLPNVRLSPNESDVLDVSRVLREQNSPWFNGIGSLEFKYSTAPGTVLVTALSVGNRDNQVFRVPMWDVAAQRSPTGGYPWYIDGNSSTTVYIKNASNTAQKYFVQINYPGGVYMIGMKTLGGGETVSYDLRKIRDEQSPDSRGRVIPLSVSSGQVHWSANGDGMMIGRSEQADLVAGTSSNYACMNCCGDIPYTDTQRVTPGSATVDTEASSLFTAEEQYEDCYGNFSEFTFVTDATWASSDANVATVESLNGNVTGAAPGSATITATWHEYVYHYNPATQSCVPHQNNYSKSATITVKPHIDNIDPPRGLIGSTVRIRINGSGLADSDGSASVEGDSAVSVNNVDGFSANETQISANVTIASNAAAGNHTLTVTVSGQSATANFFVQIPKALVRQDFPPSISPAQQTTGVGPLITITDGDVKNISGDLKASHQCGAYRNYLYQLMDQENPAQPIIAEITVDETFPPNEVSGNTDFQRTTDSVSTNNGGQLSDLNAITKPAGQCLTTATSVSQKQHFSVTIGQQQFTLTTVIRIVMGFDPTNGYNIDSSIDAP
jgi:hypothetical protein